MALQEILLDGLALGGGVEVVVEAVLDLAHQEIAGVDFPINSKLRIGHLLL